MSNKTKKNFFPKPARLFCIGDCKNSDDDMSMNDFMSKKESSDLPYIIIVSTFLADKANYIYICPDRLCLVLKK